MRCPCGSGEKYGNCCGPLHRAERTAATAEQLMRSRFSAFAVGDRAYLLETWHSSTRPAVLELDEAVQWRRLDALATTGGGPFHQEGTVEFRAHYRQDGKPGSMHENSVFCREDGQWRYVRGT
ncbi:YchJ family protein [Amycolatopsis alkalitolerans]|uniref:YchJ-like middle NTF2-like domain-containing protein n=1 Tax=Amycolatopsis alkalitolerans TaxID=2547244 RepID=A0A5C4M466_9PSEU|nr:YchJ family metal-binding protein [Amycolatopsis alkalitolerans]TNC27856.1 hypothetical protein FG385_08440 [Amycolatopsis alkalitolerans]